MKEIGMALVVALAFIWVCGLSQTAAAVGSSQPRLAGKHLTENFASLPFVESYTPLFGDDNVKVAEDGKAVMLSLDKRTGRFCSPSSLLGYQIFGVIFFIEFDCFLQAQDCCHRICICMACSALQLSSLMTILQALWLRSMYDAFSQLSPLLICLGAHN